MRESAKMFDAPQTRPPTRGQSPMGIDRADPAHGDSDETLMLRYAGGEVAAFERLYARHEGALYRFLLRSVGNAAVADELLQEVWMSVIRSAAGYEVRALFTTWLYRIARTRLVDHWRARDPELLRSLDAPVGDGGDATLADTLADDSASGPEAIALDRAQARAFTSAVEALPPAQREAFLLHLQAGLTLTQIGAITGAGAETIKSRLRYASDKLRGAMQHWRTGR